MRTSGYRGPLMVLLALVLVSSCGSGLSEPAAGSTSSAPDASVPGDELGFRCDQVESELSSLVEEGEASYRASPEEALTAAGRDDVLSSGKFVAIEFGGRWEVRDQEGELVESIRLERHDAGWIVAETQRCFDGCVCKVSDIWTSPHLAHLWRFDRMFIELRPTFEGVAT